MAKVIFETNTILYPRPDQTHAESAVKAVRSVVNTYESHDNLVFSCRLFETEKDGSAKLQIKVVDTSHSEKSDTYAFIIAIIVISFLMVLFV